MTDEEKENERLFRAWSSAGDKPTGHAPNFAISHAAFYCFKDGDPRLDAAIEEYDRDYFREHPEEREKYAYKGE
ncbi:MAG: hypothetical protein LBT53_00215 [Puniceicoccales bacterium]|jgi:hypothetical protein|nr:hypothetical protein [Puniceicoccales bacterium]